MPTSRPRHVITETDQVERALDAAASRWPEDRGNRAKLLRRLLMEGHRVIAGEQQAALAQRRQAITATSGALTGSYADGYLRELREDWPE